MSGGACTRKLKDVASLARKILAVVIAIFGQGDLSSVRHRAAHYLGTSCRRLKPKQWLTNCVSMMHSTWCFSLLLTSSLSKCLSRFRDRRFATFAAAFITASSPLARTPPRQANASTGKTRSKPAMASTRKSFKSQRPQKHIVKSDWRPEF